MKQMVVELRQEGVSHLVLHAREGEDHRDRSAIHEVIGSRPDPTFQYSHQPSATEPLLWVPDAVAWAGGRGGHWRKRVEELHLIRFVTHVEVP